VPVVGRRTAHLRVNSKLSVAELLEIGERAAATRPSGMKAGPGRLQAGSRKADGLMVTALWSGNDPWMTFDWGVVGQREAGRTTMVTEIDKFSMTQDRLLGIIPMGPKTIRGFYLYKHFMDTVAVEVTRRDPSANVRRLD
jgi:hypothetical protein